MRSLSPQASEQVVFGQRCIDAGPGELVVLGGPHPLLGLQRAGEPAALRVDLGGVRDERGVADRPLDTLLRSLADSYGARVLAVVLTGMGNDGLEGAQAVRAHGGRVLVQEESTCAVYGMPRAVAEAGLADVVAPLHDLPVAIAAEVR